MYLCFFPHRLLNTVKGVTQKKQEEFLIDSGHWRPWLPGLGAPLFFSLIYLAMLGLSCPVTCGILVPSPGIKPTSSAVAGGAFNHWTTREVLVWAF